MLQWNESFSVVDDESEKRIFDIVRLLFATHAAAAPAVVLLFPSSVQRDMSWQSRRHKKSSSTKLFLYENFLADIDDFSKVKNIFLILCCDSWPSVGRPHSRTPPTPPSVSLCCLSVEVRLQFYLSFPSLRLSHRRRLTAHRESAVLVSCLMFVDIFYIDCKLQVNMNKWLWEWMRMKRSDCVGPFEGGRMSRQICKSLERCFNCITVISESSYAHTQHHLHTCDLR